VTLMTLNGKSPSKRKMNYLTLIPHIFIWENKSKWSAPTFVGRRVRDRI